MNTSRAPHEALMNPSGTILPRVGGGVGEGGGCGVIHASRLTSETGQPVDNSQAAHIVAWMAADAAEIGGGR